MTKILKSGSGEKNSRYTIAGLTEKEIYTLMSIVKKEFLKAADPNDWTYDNEEAYPVLDLYNDLSSQIRNLILI